MGCFSRESAEASTAKTLAVATQRNPEVSTILVLCPTHRDRRELARLPGPDEHVFLFHDYASIELEELVMADAPPNIAVGDPLAEIATQYRSHGQMCSPPAAFQMASTHDGAMKNMESMKMRGDTDAMPKQPTTA